MDSNDTTPIFFWKPEHKHGYLSRMFLSPFTNTQNEYSSTHAFNCAEQYMMWNKAHILARPDPPPPPPKTHKSSHAIGPPLISSLPPERIHLPNTILHEPSPPKQEYLIRSYPFTALQRKSWEKTKFDVNADLKEWLLGTGERELVEAAPNDRGRGIGFSAREAMGHAHRERWGANLLGRALMVVRGMVREEVERVAVEGLEEEREELDGEDEGGDEDGGEIEPEI